MTNERTVGRVLQLTRYPVKSMAGERMERSAVVAYGLLGDRTHAFVDESKTGWGRYVTARQIPRMLGYRAELADEAPDGSGYPRLRVTAPDGREFEWDDRLLREMHMVSGRSFGMTRYPLLHSEWTAVDAGAVLLTTDLALRRLEALLGEAVDMRRFRPNIVISGVDERETDAGLVGRSLRIGTAVLQVVEPCERCMMVTIDPDTLERDGRILKKVHEALDTRFGVYATVVREGEVRTGDAVHDVGPQRNG